MSAQGEPKKMLSAVIVVNSLSKALLDIHKEIVQQLDALEVEYEMLYLVGVSDESIRSDLQRIVAQASPPVRVLEFALPVTEAAMLRAATEEARGDLIATFPACYEVDLRVVSDLYQAVLAGVDLAVACRSSGPAPLSSIHSRFFNKVVSWATGSGFRDTASHTRLLRRQVLEEIPLYGDFHRYVPVLAARSAFRVREIPADEHPNAVGPLFRSPLSYLWRGIDILTLVFISRFTRYPLRLFGGIGAAFAAVGALMLLVVGAQRLVGTPLADRPILALAVLLVGLGVQAFAIGLLGELQLYFSARRVRDYRIAATYESSPPPLRPGSEPDSLSLER